MRASRLGIRSSGSSSAASSSRVSEAGEVHEDAGDDDEEQGGRASPVWLANQRARLAAQPGDSVAHSGSSPLPCTVATNSDCGSQCDALAERRHAHALDSAHSSPAGITLWGVHRDLRRKRIKKVSHYILGSLLGEGGYGVVRDAIDINTDNVNRRFQRCAIKIVNGNYAKADMPAIFAKRDRSNSGSSQEGRGGGAAMPAAQQGTLRRTTGSGGVVSVAGSTGGMHYRREEEQRRQEGFQREMLNLQRFHCKNIIRALDSFTRYSKEYVVLPIAICSVQQLVRQLMRTRWREAVREWRRRQRATQRGRGDGSSATTSAAAAGRTSRGLPLVPSSLSTLDLDDLTFMEERDDDSEDYSNADDSTDASVDDGAEGAEDEGQEDVCGGRQDSSGSFSDRDDDAYEEQLRHSQRRAAAAATSATASASATTRRAAATKKDGTSQRRMLPRVPSSNSNNTTTTSTARTIDSYDNGNSGDVRSASRRTREHHQPGGEDETSDLSSGGVHHGSGVNCVQVMSATPPIPEDAVLLEDEKAGASGGRGKKDKKCFTAASTPSKHNVSTAAPPHQQSKTEASESTGVSLSATVIDDARPHLSFPMCSITLLKGIFYQVISGVDYLHQQNLAHNDIKPSNVLLFEDGTVKLGDLGSVSESYNDQGTPLMASPELCRYFYGAITPPSSFSQSTEAVGRDAAKPSDMWCCGLLLYYLITGKPGPLPVQIRYFQSLHSKHHVHESPPQLQQRRTQKERRGSGGSSGSSRDPQWATSAAFEERHTTSVPSSVPPPPVVTRYQLYREIAAQTTPVDLSDLPDMIPPDLGDDANDEPGVGSDEAPLSAAQYPSRSVRHLLAGLLELDPQRRLTAQQALRHPWLRMTFRLKPSEREDGRRGRKSSSAATLYAATGEEATRGSGNGQQLQSAARKTPSKQAMEEAIQRDVARRVTESRHVQRMLLQDRQRHLQFVADCCNMLNLVIPPEIIRVQPAEPYRDDVPGGRGGIGSAPSLASTGRGMTSQQRKAAAAAMAAAMVGGGRNTTRVHHLSTNLNFTSNNGAAAGAGDAVTGSVLQGAMLPDVMPPGCVDTELFLPHTEEDYYELKSGKSEFDVRVLRRKPLVMAQFDEYFHNVVLVQCGYRTGPDPNYQAMRVRAVPIEDEVGSSGGSSGSSRRRNGSGGGSGGGGGTQQPSVVILPGASSNVYRRSQTMGLPQLAVTAVDGGAANNTNASTPCVAGGGAAGVGDAAVLVEDLWGAGPRHVPRAHFDAFGNLLAPPAAAAPAPAAAAAATPAAQSAIRGAARDESRGGRNTSQPIVTRAATSNNNNNGTNNSAFAVNPRSPGAANNNANTTSTRSSAAGGGGSSGHHHQQHRNSVDAMDTQEVIGTAVVNTARVSGGMHNSSATNAANTRRSGAAGRTAGRAPREGSESASEAEQNVAMRESSKCLCGLM